MFFRLPISSWDQEQKGQNITRKASFAGVLATARNQRAGNFYVRECFTGSSSAEIQGMCKCQINISFQVLD